MSAAQNSELVPSSYAHLSRMIAVQLQVFPRHQRFLSTRFASSDPTDLAFDDQIAGLVLTIADPSIEAVCEDYRWLVQWLLEEQMHFRKFGRYRSSNSSDTMDNIYSNDTLMRRYMNGLLASQIWWKNHSDPLRAFRDKFIAGNCSGFSHLEIGPGHGLFLYLVATSPNCSAIQGWDISPASIEASRSALQRMGVSDKVVLRVTDLFGPHEQKFSSIGCSGVLGALENPGSALERIGDLLLPGGRLFVNAPVTAPAPDQLHLFRTPEELVDLMKDHGFEILYTEFVPPAGTTLELARVQSLVISAVVIAAPR